MKVILVDRDGRLRLAERPDPEPQPGHTRIQVRAAGVNFADCLARQGFYPDAPPRPFVPGYEVAGLAPDGRRVMAFTRFGGYAELAVVPDDQIFGLPESFTFEEGAGFLVTSMTAVVAMLGYGPLRRGDRVLVHAAAGGVGTCAVQIGVAYGAELFGTAGSDEKCRHLAAMGVAHPINYRREDWARYVCEAGGRLDLVLDSLGGPSIRKGLALLAPGGRLVAFGIAGGSGGGPLRLALDVVRGAFLNSLRLMLESKALIGLNLLRLGERSGVLGEHVRSLEALVRAGQLRPHIGATFPLAEAARAHAFIESRQSIGKVVLTTV